MNLVGPETLADPWRRHFLDSAQLVAHLEPRHRIVTDLGSGAGFPGLVVCVLTGLETHLVEANGRKAAFLREAVRLCAAPATVHHGRIESIDPWPTDVLTARALAPLCRLLDMAERFSTAGDNKPPTCLFLKGETAPAELTEAGKVWNMRATLAGSLTSPSGHVLRIDYFERLRGGS